MSHSVYGKGHMSDLVNGKGYMSYSVDGKGHMSGLVNSKGRRTGLRNCKDNRAGFEKAEFQNCIQANLSGLLVEGGDSDYIETVSSLQKEVQVFTV